MCLAPAHTACLDLRQRDCVCTLSVEHERGATTHERAHLAIGSWLVAGHNAMLRALRTSLSPQQRPAGSAASTDQPRAKLNTSFLGSFKPRRRSSVVESLTEMVKKKLGAKEQKEREAWKKRNVGRSANLKLARAHALHTELRGKGLVGPRVDFTSSHFGEMMTEFEGLASSLESGSSCASLGARIGAGLIAQGRLKDRTPTATATAEALIALWDRNGDNQISKMEWRVGVRALPGLENEDYHKIDDLFLAFDADGSGYIEPAEMQVAFASWHQAALDADRELDSVRTRVAALRLLAKELRHAVHRTAELEAEEAKLSHMQSADVSLESRIGRVLLSRNMTAGDMARAWDTNNDGTIDLVEFRFHIRKLGSGLQAASNGELDVLFASLDTDGGGSLDVAALKASLIRFSEAHAKAMAALEAQIVLVKAMVKPVKKLHAEVLKKLRNAEPLPANGKRQEIEMPLCA